LQQPGCIHGTASLEGSMNREWHQQHKMPAAVGPQERIDWHMEHLKHCACRPFPAGLLAKMSQEQKRRITDGRTQPAEHRLR